MVFGKIIDGFDVVKVQRLFPSPLSVTVSLLRDTRVVCLSVTLNKLNNPLNIMPALNSPCHFFHLQKMEAQGSQSGQPLAVVRIADSGELPL